MGIVRALFATSPGLGHVFPTISLAHALRAAGHEVLVATAGGKEAANAGLHVVDTAPGVDIGAVFQQAASEQHGEFDYSTDVDTEKGLESSARSSPSRPACRWTWPCRRPNR